MKNNIHTAIAGPGPIVAFTVVEDPRDPNQGRQSENEPPREDQEDMYPDNPSTTDPRTPRQPEIEEPEEDRPIEDDPIETPEPPPLDVPYPDVNEGDEIGGSGMPDPEIGQDNDEDMEDTDLEHRNDPTQTEDTPII